MNQVFYTLKTLLQHLGIAIPNSVINHLLYTPIGASLRGISDALDSLNIGNNVYQLPKEYLKELDYPYIMVLPNQKETFCVVANDAERDVAIPAWGGIVLTAQKTASTPTYKYVWLRNVVDNIINHQLSWIIATLIIAYFCFYKPTFFSVSHAILSGLGLWISTMLLEKEYLGGKHEKFCKIGSVIDCEQVLNSKGSQIMGIFKMSDFAFMFFTTHLLLFLMANDSWFGYSFLLLLAGCTFTLYSVVYQIVGIHKICIYCMAINIIVWLDMTIFMLNHSQIDLHNPFLFILAAAMTYIIWRLVARYLPLASQINPLKSKVAGMYNRELFDLLLSKERGIAPVDDKYADIGGTDNGDVITIFVHPNCKNCKRVYRFIPDLRKDAIVKTVSLADGDAKLREYCRTNQINKTPTIVFNGRVLPEIYDIEDLKYLI